jgi:hypothetical protein
MFMFDGNICAQDPVCVNLYNEGLALMNKKDKSSYQEAIKKFEAAGICDEKLQGDCRKRISECKKAIDTPPASTPTPTPKTAPASTQKTTPPPAPAPVRPSKNKILFSEQGGIENISVSGDRSWSVSSDVAWCVAKRGDNLIVITCEQNKTLFPRKANIEVKGSNNSETIILEQDAAKEYLTLSEEVFEYTSSGGVDTVRISTNSENWTFENLPSWCNVRKTGADEFIISCQENRTDRARRETIQLKTSLLTVDVKVSQEARKQMPTESGITAEAENSGRDRKVAPENEVLSEEQSDISEREASSGRVRRDASSRREVIYDDHEDVSGQSSSDRKISFGIMANVLIPGFSVKSSSALGSAVNYGYGGKLEKPSYSAEMGYSGGVVADIRIAKNIYIQTGLYYTNININNEVKGVRNDIIENYTTTTYIEGTVSYKFTEKYTFNYIELPVLFSYRYHVSDNFIWQINAGPYIGYGITGKAKIEGTQDWPELKEYYYNNGWPTGEVYYMNSSFTGKIDMFGKTGSLSRTYTTGDRPRYDTKGNFENTPLRNLDAGISLGTAFEFAGVNIGVYYDIGLMNMANGEYWKSERIRISDDIENVSIDNYVHKLNKIQVRIGYIYRW